MHVKIKTLSELSPILHRLKQQGKRIVQCHGVFDLLHLGHVRHFQEAKNQGDILVITVTCDKHVNKGPGRPAFSERQRMEAIAALSMTDFVLLSEAPDATTMINAIKPDIFVKGAEYQDHTKDITGKITQETKAVHKWSGKIHYTHGIVFSSSALLNQYFDLFPPGVQKFIHQIKKTKDIDQIISTIHKLADIKVLVIGDAILDEYQYVDPLGQSGKGLHMVANCKEKEVFLGGSLIVANHIAQYSNHVTLLTSLGNKCPYKKMIQEHLDPKIDAHIIDSEQETTLIKKRYVLQDGNTLTKLFETYSHNRPLLSQEKNQEMINYLHKVDNQFDLVLVCDFGNGLLSPPLREKITNLSPFLAINTQINSGNRGFNVITQYQRADFICLNEPELRLAAHDKNTPIEAIMEKIAGHMHAQYVAVTRGVDGAICKDHKKKIDIPVFNEKSIDRIGAGDCFLALSSLVLAATNSIEEAGFLGSVAAALGVQIVGNKEPIKKAALCKFITRLLK